MLEQIQGVVKKILNKPLAQTDQWGNTTRLSVLIDDKSKDGVWIGFGAKKQEGLSVKQGMKFKDVGIGAEVCIFAERKGEYINAKTSDVKLLKEGSQAPVAAAAPSQRTQQTSGFVDRDTEIKAGMFFNKAVDVAIAKHGEKVSKSTVVQAYQMLSEAYDECRSVKKVPEQRDHAPDEDDGVDINDELPF